MDTRRESLRSGFIVSVMLFGLLLATPSWAWVQCGDTIGPNKIAYLKQDLTCNLGNTGGNTALTLIGPNAVLKLGGHTVTCDGIDVGILLTESGAILSGGLFQHGTVKNCNEDGVQVSGTGGHHIKKVTATGNEDGFMLLFGSHTNTFIYNTATNNLIGFVGPEETNENEFRSNTSTNNRIAGYTVRGNRNTFKYNLAKNNRELGFLLIGNDTLLTKNRAITNRIGFAIEGNRNTVIANLARGNDTIGLGMGEGSGYKVIGNWAKNNLLGILLDFRAINSTVLWNVALGNTEFDLVDENDDCDDNKWKWNWFKTSDPPRPGCIK